MTTMNDFESATKLIWQLGQQYGIEPVYYDGLGVERQVTVPHLRQVLASMGVKASTKKDIRDSLSHAVSRTWTQLIDSVVVRYPSDSLFMLPLSLPLGDIRLEQIALAIQIMDEKGASRHLTLLGASGEVKAQKTIEGVKYVQVHFPLSGEFPLGYFRLSVRVKLHSERTVEGQTLLIVAPRKCYLPSSPKRAWGISLQLYGLRSHRNWGIGDFRDLEEIMKVAGIRWGVATIGVNPLHIPAAGLSSPYSPSSRLFWSPVYLNLEGVDEWRTSAGLRQKAKSAKFQHTLQQLREGPL